MGTPQSDDVLIYKDPEHPDWMFDAHVSNDGEHLFLSTRRDTNEICLVQHANLVKNAELNKEIVFDWVIKEWIAGFDYVHNVGSKVYLKTNHEAPRSKIIAIDLENVAQDNWTEVLPQHEQNVLQSGDCINGVIVACYL